MATALEIIRGLAQAAANSHDGAIDDNGELVKIGLKREEGHPILDSRVMDGFKVRFSGNSMILTYQAEIRVKDVHDTNKFESEIESTLADVAKFLKKEYKKVTGDSFTLKPSGEVDILVQKASQIHAWAQATQVYEIGNLKDVEPVSEPSEDRLDDSIKKWLSIGKETYPGAKKPRNVVRREK